MSVLDLCSLQLTLFAMMLVGAILKKKGMINEEGKRCLSDLCIDVVIPCNIFKSCLLKFDSDILKTCGMLLISACIVQGFCLVLNLFLYNRYPGQRKKCCNTAPSSP